MLDLRPLRGAFAFFLSRPVVTICGLVIAVMVLALWRPNPAAHQGFGTPAAVLAVEHDASTIASVVEKFAPQVRMHPEERYFPSSVPWYLERTQVHTEAREVMGDLPTLLATTRNENLKQTNVSLKEKSEDIAKKLEGKLEQKLGESLFGKYFLKIKKQRPDYELASRRGDIDSATTYVHVRKRAGRAKGLDIQYWFFYPYSGPVLVGPAGGAHEGDWEHITVRLAAGLQRVEKVFFAAHDREGLWVDGSDVQYEQDTHPVVYSARYGHASYPSAGIQARGMLPADRTADGGKTWQTWENTKIVADPSGLRDNIRWLRFAGRWGRTGVLFSGPRGPAFQRYWTSEM